MSTGGRVFPSVTGGGLSAAAQAFLDAQLAERARALESRRLDIAERAQAINQFAVLNSFLPPGTTLGDLGGAGMTLFERAFQMSPEGLESLELRPETLQTALDARARDLIETEEGAALILPSVRALLGLEPSEAVAQTRDLEAQMRFNALTQILEDPELTSEFTARALGREPVTLTIPGIGDIPDRTISFDSTTAANIYAQFLLGREQFGFRLDLEREDPIAALIEETKTAVEAAGQSVSSTALRRVLSVYNDAVEAQDISSVIEFLEDPSVSEGEKLGLQFLLGSIRVGEEAFIEQLPPQLANFLRIGQVLREVLPAEQVSEVMESITQALDPAFTAQLRDPFLGGLRLEVGGRPIGPRNPLTDQEPEQEDGDGFSLRDVPEGILMEEIRRALSEGISTREELIGLVGEDLVNRAVPPIERDPVTPSFPEGGINPDSVPVPLRADVQQLNNLIRTLERTRGNLARQNLQGAIDRLRERIEARMRSLDG